MRFWNMAKYEIKKLVRIQNKNRLGCTNSNDPGQLGSRYGVYPHPVIPLLDFIDEKS